MTDSTQPDDLSVLAELVGRWRAKSPKLFVYIQWISGVCAFITKGPHLIDWGLSQLELFNIHVQLPASFLTFENSAVAISAATAFLISRLTVSTPSATKSALIGGKVVVMDDDGIGGTSDGGGTDPNKPQPPKP